MDTSDQSGLMGMAALGMWTVVVGVPLLIAVLINSRLSRRAPRRKDGTMTPAVKSALRRSQRKVAWTTAAVTVLALPVFPLVAFTLLGS